MERRTINPWQWKEKLGYSQAIDVTNGERVLYCAGQTSTGPDGQPRYPGDMRAQLAAAMDNVEAVLQTGGYELKDVARINYYTTDIPAFFAGYSIITDGRHGTVLAPDQSLEAWIVAQESEIRIDAQPRRRVYVGTEAHEVSQQ